MLEVQVTTEKAISVEFLVVANSNIDTLHSLISIEYIFLGDKYTALWMRVSSFSLILSVK